MVQRNAKRGSAVRLGSMHTEQLLRAWGTDTLVICGALANSCVHYTAASAALRWYDVVIPRDTISALEPFDVESSLRQTAFVLAGRITTAAGVRISGRQHRHKLGPPRCEHGPSCSTLAVTAGRVASTTPGQRQPRANH